MVLRYWKYLGSSRAESVQASKRKVGLRPFGRGGPRSAPDSTIHTFLRSIRHDRADIPAANANRERAGGGRQGGGQRAGDRVYLAKAIRRRDHRERRRSDEGKSREHSGVYAQTGDHLVIRGLGSFFCPTSDEREEGKVAAAATAAAVTEEGEAEEDREEEGEEEEEEEEEGFLVN